ncbi:MAG: ATP-dependent metallopeptidase FtsH/Yme1/Tma family protein, partial [Sneathiella sp.]
MNLFGKNIVLWVIIALLVVALFNIFNDPSPRNAANSMAYSAFLTEVENGRVKNVTIQGPNIKGVTDDGRSFTTYAPEDASLVSKLSAHGVSITAAPKEEGSMLMATLLSWFPMLLLIGVWIFFMRQ